MENDKVMRSKKPTKRIGANKLFDLIVDDVSYHKVNQIYKSVFFLEINLLQMRWKIEKICRVWHFSQDIFYQISNIVNALTAISKSFLTIERNYFLEFFIYLLSVEL